MDKLKEILLKSKPTVKLVEQKKVIAQQTKRRREQQEEERRVENEMKDQKIKKLQQFFEYDIRRKKIKSQEEIKIPLISEEQLRSRFRALHQPIKLFAESYEERQKRLLKIEEFYKNNPSFDMKTYDEQFQLKLKEQEEFNELDAKYRERLIEPRLGDDPNYIKKKSAMILEEQQTATFESMCDEVFLWIHKILRDWNQALQQKYNTQELREKYHQNWARYEESSSDVKSLLHVLKNRGGNKDMIRSIYHIMNCCLVREYIQANDKYIDLSIGNAPWPMGIAMLSITVRRNAPKVSHVLDEQMSRRWMQSLKRFITVSQEIYPSHEQGKRVGYSVKSAI